MKLLKDNVISFFCGALLVVFVILIFLDKIGFFTFMNR